jgi:hypothetical protein
VEGDRLSCFVDGSTAGATLVEPGISRVTLNSPVIKLEMYGFPIKWGWEWRYDIIAWTERFYEGKPLVDPKIGHVYGSLSYDPNSGHGTATVDLSKVWKKQHLYWVVTFNYYSHEEHRHINVGRALVTLSLQQPPPPPPSTPPFVKEKEDVAEAQTAEEVTAEMVTKALETASGVSILTLITSILPMIIEMM